MDIFNYHAKTKIFIRKSEARPDPKENGRFLIPANATNIQVIEHREGYNRYFNGSEWEYKLIKTEQPSEYHEWDDINGWTITEENQTIYEQQLAEQQLQNIKDGLENAVDNYINSVAKVKGYDSKQSCCSYAAGNNKYTNESIAFIDWMASCWDHCFAKMIAVENEEAEIPTQEELIAELPEMVWPE